MQLPEKKLQSLKALIKKAIIVKYITIPNLREVNGKIRHGAIGMPQANGIFLPINEVLSKNIKVHKLTKDSPLTLVLKDALIMLQMITEEPTPVQ